MSATGKKTIIDVECRVWTSEYVFTQVNCKALCLVCGKQVAVLKDYNLNKTITRHV